LTQGVDGIAGAVQGVMFSGVAQAEEEEQECTF
jgi:hypothetical protein